MSDPDQFADLRANVEANALRAMGHEALHDDVMALLAAHDRHRDAARVLMAQLLAESRQHAATRLLLADALGAASEVAASWGDPIPSRRRGRPPVVPDDEYQRTADIYRAAQADGRPTTAAVMEALGLGSSAARKRIMGARERGLLPPTNGTTRPRV